MPRAYANLRELNQFNRNLLALQHDVDRAVKYGIYDGIGIFADAIRQELKSDMLVVSDKAAIASWVAKVPVYLCESQRQGLLDGLNIRRIRKKHGIIYTRTEFVGYNKIKTKRWPQGQPNTLIAAACEHGNTVLIEQPFIRIAYKVAKEKALDLFRKTCANEIEKILNK